MQKNSSSVRKKILLTGGHAATTAMAVVEELKKRTSGKHQWNIFWVGPKYAMEGKKVLTSAQKILPKQGVEFHTIVSGRVQRKFTKWTVISLLKIPVGFILALVLVNRIKPDIILSFGGYAAFPVVIIGWMMRIPVVIHDQTYSFNSSSRMVVPFVNKIALSRERSKRYYPKGKCVVTGNPVRSGIVSIKPKDTVGDPPTLYITGGSTGSVSLNNLIEEILADLLASYKVLHQVGDLDYGKFESIRERLPKFMKRKYEVYKYLGPVDVVEAFRKSDIIISRAGANIVSEIIMMKRPSVLIPLAVGRHNEQRKNAEYAQKCGIAVLLEQEGLSSRELLSSVNRIYKSYGDFVAEVKDKESPDLNAASSVVDILEEIVL